MASKGQGSPEKVGNVGWGEGGSCFITQPGRGLAHSLLTRLARAFGFLLTGGLQSDGAGLGLG